MQGLIVLLIQFKCMIMKTLKYILLGILFISIVPVCKSQTSIKSKQVVALQSVPGNAPAKLLAESKEVLMRRLTCINLHDVQIAQNNAKSELVITVGDTISKAALSEILLIQGNVSFKADTTLFLDRENLLKVVANFDDPKQPALCITLNENKWKVWEDITTRNMNKPVAFVIDGKEYAAPQIVEPISHGMISLTGGGFSGSEVGKLVAIISSGPLPLKFNIVSTH